MTARRNIKIHTHVVGRTGIHIHWLRSKSTDGPRYEFRIERRGGLKGGFSVWEIMGIINAAPRIGWAIFRDATEGYE
jgi:hypothetical protein